ncbi:MAG: AAA-like domain-containing protein [Cyanobacteria bacterium P01_F01_bin.116]
MVFEVHNSIQIANWLVLKEANRNLKDLEIAILKGSWNELEYDQIAAQNQYTTSYISQDSAPKLWNLLSKALGEKVRKSNFKEVLRRAWERYGMVVSEETALTVSIASQISGYPTQSSIYIMRPSIEAQCYEALGHFSALIRIKAPRYMGKTFLIQHLCANLSASGIRTANLSFELADRNTHLTNLNKFLRWLCLNISRELGIPNQIDEIWDEEGIGAKVSCTAYFEEYLLSQPDCPLVLCLDDVDLLFPHPEVYEDFFGLLRSWYEKGKTRNTWKNLRLIIAHATDVYIRLNINQSPFNVGLPIELPEFSIEQAKDLARQHGMKEEAQLETLIEWVGGHPYLLEKTFIFLKNHPETALEILLANATSIMEVYQDHLRDKWFLLQETPKLINAFTEVVRASSPVKLDPIVTYQLQRIGLVKPAGNGVVTRCRLYSEYFKENPVL